MIIQPNKRYVLINGVVLLPSPKSLGPEPAWAMWYATPNGRFNMGWWFSDGRSSYLYSREWDIKEEYKLEMG